MTPAPRILIFAGDSITDSGQREDPGRLGDGYVRLIADAARSDDVAVVNAGISGDRVVDLQRRWEADVLAARPQVLTVLIGVNDMWRRYDSGDATSAVDFERAYDDVLGLAVAGGVESIILMEPFLVPIDQAQVAWKAEDLAEKIEVTRRLAVNYDAVLVPLDAVLNSAAATRAPEDIAFDGVHPTALGHRLIADEWWTVFNRFGS